MNPRIFKALKVDHGHQPRIADYEMDTAAMQHIEMGLGYVLHLNQQPLKVDIVLLGGDEIYGLITDHISAVWSCSRPIFLNLYERTHNSQV